MTTPTPRPWVIPHALLIALLRAAFDAGVDYENAACFKEQPPATLEQQLRKAGLDLTHAATT